MTKRNFYLIGLGINALIAIVSLIIVSPVLLHLTIPYLIILVILYHSLDNYFGKRRLLYLLKEIKRQIPKKNLGLCTIINEEFDNSTTIIECKSLLNILLLHKQSQKNKIIVDSLGYWWPIEDRQSRIDFINSIIHNIKFYKAHYIQFNN